MNNEQKLLLLRSAISLPFSTKINLFQTLSSQFPHLSLTEIEEFFDEIVDFASISQWKQEQNHEQNLKLGEEEPSFIISPSESPVKSSSSTYAPPSPPPKPTPSPPLVVPARTPSGRTLRSNSTVNTSEPRRLRSNK